MPRGAVDGWCAGRRALWQARQLGTAAAGDSQHPQPCRKQVMGVFWPGAAARAWPRAQVCELATRQHRGICRQQAAGFSAISQPATGP